MSDSPPAASPHDPGPRSNVPPRSYHAAGSSDSRPPVSSLGRLLRECVPIVLCHRGWLAAAAGASLSFALLEPVQGVVVKQVVDGLQDRTGTTAEVVLRAIPRYLCVLVGLALLSFLEKCLKGFYDPRLIFALQQSYLQRRPTPHVATDVSRMQYDCMYGRKALEIFARDVWHIGVTLGAVVGIQGALAPEWLPPLVVLIVLLVGAVLMFGVGVTRSNQAMFDAVEPVAACVEDARRHELVPRQMRLYGRLKRREAWMGASEVIVQLTLWCGCLASLWVVPALRGATSPAEMDAGGMALFVINLQIISRPLVEIGKAYNKICSNIPALRRTLFPAEHEAVDVS